MWAGPAQINGPNSAQQRKVGPNSAQPKILLQSGPGPAQTCKAGPASGWPNNRPAGGEFSPPPPPACSMPEANLQRRKKRNVGGRKCTWCGGGGHGWRPVAVARLTDGGSKRWRCCSTGGEREISSPSPLFFFVFCSSLSLPFSWLLGFLFLLLFFVCSFSSPSIPFVLSLFPLSSVFFFVFGSSLSPPLLPLLFFFLFSIYKSERALGPSLVRLGSGFRGGWSATTRDSKAPLPCFGQGEQPVVGH